MAPWLSPAAPKRVSGELRLSDGAETASSVAGAYCLITPDALLTRWYPANFLRWGNRIFTHGLRHVFLTPHGSKREHRSSDVEQTEECGNGGHFIRLLLDLQLPQHETVRTGPGTHHRDSSLGGGLI